MDLDFLFLFLFVLISCSRFFWMFLTVCLSVGGFGCLCESFDASSLKTVSFGLVGCLRVLCRESCLSRGLVLWGASNMPTWRFSRHLRYFLFPLPIADHSHGLHYFSCILSAVCGYLCVVARVCFLMR